MEILHTGSLVHDHVFTLRNLLPYIAQYYTQSFEVYPAPHPGVVNVENIYGLNLTLKYFIDQISPNRRAGAFKYVSDSWLKS